MGTPISCHSDDPNTAGVLGEGPTGVYGRNTLGTGNGIIGYSDAGRGVWGHSNLTGYGVLGESNQGIAVAGTSQASYGVRGHSNKIAGIRGSSDLSRGVEGWAKGSEGVVGISETGNGVWGQAAGAGLGVLGTSQTGIGVWGKGGHLAGFFEGDVEVTGDLRLTNADCAEDFDIVGATAVEPGTVMVLDSAGALMASQNAYDKRVAGVISGAGGYKPGIIFDRQHSPGNRQPIALMGKAFCKVDATYGAIEVGDLLTTSSTPGHAMKAGEPGKAFGAVIGKALRPFNEGQGLIPILIALQ